MKHKYIYITLFFFLSLFHYGTAQKSKLDSLNRDYQTTKNDTNRIWDLLNMADVLYSQNTDSAKKLWAKSVEIADKALQYDSVHPVSSFYTLRLVNIKSEAIGGLGYVYFITDNPDKGLMYERISLALLKIAGNKKDMAQAYNNVGYMYTEKGDLYTSIQFYDTSLTMRRELKDTDGISTVINNLGYLYQQLEDSAKALQNYREALQLRVKIRDIKGMSTTLNNIATVKSKAGQIDEAITYYKQSLSCARLAKSNDEIALLDDNLASCFQKKGQSDTAFLYATRSLKEYTELNDKEGMAYAMGYIGVILSDKGKKDSAKKYLDKAFMFANQLGYKTLIAQIANYSYRLYKDMGDYKRAYELYVTYKETTDSINNKKAEKEVIRTQLKYDYQKREIEQQEKQKQVELTHNEELKRQHIIIGAITLGLILLGAFILVLASRLRIIRKQKIVIERQKIIVEEKNKDMTDSIKYASQIQQTILPEAEQIKSLFTDSFVLWKPKDIVSGDFYWISNTKGHRYILAADCTGHGVPGALMSMVGAELFNEAVNIKGLVQPAEVLTEVRTGIISSLRQKGAMGEQKDGMDASLCVFGNPAADGSVFMQFAGANNPLWIIKSNTGDATLFAEIPANKQPIGIHGDTLSPFTQQTVSLQKGDTVYLFSDGYADQFGGPRGKKFKYSQLKEILMGFRNVPLAEQYQILQKTFADWKGNLEQIDDVLIIGIRV